MSENTWERISLREYVEDRGRYSGSVLSMVEHEPEALERWLRGERVSEETPATGRGSFFHHRLLEPNDDHTQHFARYPNRNEAMEPEMREAVGPRGGKRKEPTGRMVPQDPSEAGARKSALRNTSAGAELHSSFMAAARGKTIVYPEDMPKIGAMLRAVHQHPEAAALLEPSGLEAELTGHWTCPVTGALMRIRPDGLRRRERLWIEVKTYEPRKGERLDTLDPSAVLRWCREQGWHRKSALLSDGCMAIDRVPYEGRWIVVEATEDSPRVSVVIDTPEMVGGMYTIGRDGVTDPRDGTVILRGYLDLLRECIERRKANDYRHDCVREPVPFWPFPGWVLGAMEADTKPPPIKGARRIEVAHG